VANLPQGIYEALLDEELNSSAAPRITFGFQETRPGGRTGPVRGLSSEVVGKGTSPRGRPRVQPGLAVVSSRTHGDSLHDTAKIASLSILLFG